MMKKKLSILLMVVFMITTLPLQVFAEETCNHTWSNWIVETEPDCSQTGNQYRYCTKCDEGQTVTLPATGLHEWDSWVKTKSPTINRTGLQKRECEVCGKIETKAIAKLKPFVKLSKKTVKLKVSNTYKLKVKYAKGDAVKKYKSKNKKIATVSKKGKITGKKKGTTKITVVMKSGKKATCTVKVSAKKKTSSNNNSNGTGGNNGNGNSNNNTGGTGSGTVYWTPNGEVYHSTKNCRTLSRSKTIYSGSIDECPKPRGCKVCY